MRLSRAIALLKKSGGIESQPETLKCVYVSVPGGKDPGSPQHLPGPPQTPDVAAYLLITYFGVSFLCQECLGGPGNPLLENCFQAHVRYSLNS